MAHSHPHHGAASGDRTRSLAWTLALVVAYTAAEVIGGLWSGSLALLADAGHMVSDAAALALTLFAIRFARRAPTSERTFGFHRAEILAALVNGVTLIAIAIFILLEAYERLLEPQQVEGGLMLGVAAGGLAVNLAGLWLLGGGHAHDLNVRGAWLHVLTDALGSVQAIVAGILILTYGWYWVDPVASILIALLVVYSAWSLVSQSVHVLMEGSPAHIPVADVRTALKSLDTRQRRSRSPHLVDYEWLRIPLRTHRRRRRCRWGGCLEVVRARAGRPVRHPPYDDSDRHEPDVRSGTPRRPRALHGTLR